MAHQDRAVTQRRELLPQSRLPARVIGIGFVGHVRVADFLIRPEFSLEALDEFVVPFVMRALAATLNEQHLMWHPVSSSVLRMAEPRDRSPVGAASSSRTRPGKLGKPGAPAEPSRLSAPLRRGQERLHGLDLGGGELEGVALAE